MSITSNCMTVNLHIGVWSGHRLDKVATQNLLEDANAEEDAATVNKHLLDKKVRAPITTAIINLRAHVYNSTMPWKDNGDRLLTRKRYMPFIERYEQLEREFYDAVEHLLTKDYLSVRERAEFRMGAMFDPSDYPPIELLRPKFYARLVIDAVTEAGDFRVDQDQLTAIRNDITSSMQSRITGAVGDLWGRLSKSLQHFADRMEPDARFKETTLTNLIEIAELIPDLNFTADPALDRIAAEIRQVTLGVTAKDLRQNPDVRASVSAEAKRIIEDMSGFMKAFGATP
jgi:hypothetical protein